ncbi:MAG: phosphatase PAP2 family protein [Ferruginibacter sp.]|nr:phosphatase PAP2 family protein [Ferruginibacter sp.]
MKINFQSISENKPYVFSCSTLFTVLSLLTMFYDKVTIFFFLNTFHHQWIDFGMLFITNCGTGLFSLLVLGAVCLTKNWRLARNILLTFLVSGALVQTLKPLYSAPRPKAIISADAYSWFFEGITHSGLTSFPSGHATTIFALATVLAFTSKKKYITLVYFFFATLVAYSRVYLGQHFMEDVLAGAILGTLTTTTLTIFTSRFTFFNKQLSPKKQFFSQWTSNLR